MTELEPGPRSNSLCTGAPSPKNKVWERDICGTQLTFAQHRHLLPLNFFEGRWQEVEMERKGEGQIK